jgi:hypothetical protein
VENRTWTTSWRGVLVVHAGQRWDPTGAAVAAAHGVPPGRVLPIGYLGVVELAGIHRDTGCCRPWGQPDTYHWQLTRPRRFPAPIPVPGRLGLHRPYPLWATWLAALADELTTSPEGSHRDEHR